MVTSNENELGRDMHPAVLSPPSERVRKKKMTLLGSVCVVLVASTLLGIRAFAFDRLYEPTPVGQVEVKDLPARRALSSRAEGTYFQRDNRLFMNLFDYIKENDIAMTVPVEAEIDNAEMRFFVGDGHPEAALQSQGAVTVGELPARQVVSLGVRGAYTEEAFTRARQRLQRWLAQRPQWRAIAPPYAVYWNGPYVPSPLRRSEVHIPIVEGAPDADTGAWRP